MKKIILIVMILASVLLVGCSNNDGAMVDETVSASAGEKITVVTTLYPLYEFANAVGVDNVEVVLLLPPGAEPHSYDPKPSDIKTLSEADVFLYIGDAMEPWAHDLLEGTTNTNLQIVEAMDFVTLIEGGHDHHHEDEHHEDDHVDEHDSEHDEMDTHDEEHDMDEAKHDDHDDESYDPHVWLDFANNKLIVDELATVFGTIDSVNAQLYLENARVYTQALHLLDERYVTELAECGQDEFLVGGHNFFGYIEHRYGLEGISVIENLEPNAEPTPQSIQELIEIAQEHQIKYILTEVIVSQRTAQAIADEVDAEILVFIPGASIPKDDFENGVSFIELMQQNLETLKTALECK